LGHPGKKLGLKRNSESFKKIKWKIKKRKFPELEDTENVLLAARYGTQIPIPTFGKYDKNFELFETFLITVEEPVRAQTSKIKGNLACGVHEMRNT